MVRSAQVAAAYRQLTGTGEAFRARVRLTGADDTPAGVTVGELGRRPELAGDLVEGARARLERAHGIHVPHYVAATRVLHDYAWPGCLLVSAPWFLAGVVPDLAEGDVALEPATGLLHVRALDQVRGGAGADEVRRVVAAHHAPLVAALGPHLRRGDRAAWGTVSDDLLSGVWWLGRLVGDEAAGVRAGTELLPTPTAPFRGEAAFRSIVADDGSRHLTRTRVACCLKYVVEDGACLTCPRTAEPERRARLVGC